MAEGSHRPGRVWGLAGAGFVVLAVGGYLGARVVHRTVPLEELPPADAPGAANGSSTLDPRGPHLGPDGPLHDKRAQEDEDPGYAFRLPSGEAPALSCGDARRIVSQVRTTLAYPPEPIAARAFAASTADWLDPHGLWSAAPDSPLGARIEKRGADLLAEIEGRANDGCAAAKGVGRDLVRWMEQLRARFDKSVNEGTSRDVTLATAPLPLDGSSANPRAAMELAAVLGERVGAFARATAADGEPFVRSARDRFFPPLDEAGWARVVLAAAVRAYVPLVDPHGAWAPLDEEQSVYEVDLASRPPSRLWDRSERTALGVRIGDGASPPFQTGDLLLSLAGVNTAGLPLEQLEQLSFAAADTPAPVIGVLLRPGENGPRPIAIPPAAAPAPEDESERDVLESARVAYGSGDALVVPIHDVRDDLGEALARTMGREKRAADRRPLTGVVLDLRGNGGGSTDGAIAALGLFLPGAPLFPMRRRDGTLETDRAPEPPPGDRWAGPVATLIDGETASAAEMIAGALAVYRRGPAVGALTYGKGCAQEYLDDDAHAGVLRLTTLLYALPDGTAVQRVGLTPTIAVSLAGAGSEPEPDEREATLSHAPPTWRGPDVRDHRAPLPEEAWPPNAGTVGPCTDADVCRALRALGGASAKRRPAHAR